MASNVGEHSGGNGHGSGGNGHGIGVATASTRSSRGNGHGSLYGVQIDGGQDIELLRGTSGPIPAADPARTHHFSLAQVCHAHLHEHCCDASDAALRVRVRSEHTFESGCS
jgi:hypothetical protein